MVQFALSSVHPARSASVVIQIQGSVILTAIPAQASHCHATATGFCESQEGYWSAVFCAASLTSSQVETLGFFNRSPVEKQAPETTT
jgi:hypothetical protein